MRLRTGMFVVLALVAAASSVSAGKLGFVDAERVVMQVDEGKAKFKELEAWASPLQDKVQAAGEYVAEIRQQIGKQRGVASPETLERLGRDELDARRAFEDAKRTFERDLAAKRDEFLGEVAIKVGTVASDYGRANGFDAILVLKAQPIIFLADDADLTDLVIRLYNERFPVK